MTDDEYDARPPAVYHVEDREFAPQVPWENLTAYERWQRAQHIPIHDEFFVRDLAELTTGPWEMLGGEGAFIELEGAEDTNGAYLFRLGAGKTSNWYGGMFEQVFYVVSGRGQTEAVIGGESNVCDWRTGSVFTVPVDVPLRHHATEDATVYVVTSAPLMMNLLHEDEFVLNPKERLPQHTPPGGKWFAKEGKLWTRKNSSWLWETTFVEDVANIELPPAPGRGAGGSILALQLGRNALVSHISQFPIGTYKKGHRHGPGAHVITLAGEGYSLLWKDTFDDHRRVDWGANAVLVPPRYWWHQHFNVGAAPARYLAIRWGSPRFPLDHSYDRVQQHQVVSEDQVEYEDEDPSVMALFEQECAKRGVSVNHDLMFKKKNEEAK